MEIKEIEQVKEIPYGMNLEDWFEKEGFKIESYLQENKENYNLIVYENDDFPYIPKSILILDYKTKRFECTELKCTELNQDVDKFNSYYYVSMVKTFYKLKGWELPKVKEVIKIKNLKYGECFRFYSTKYKFICIEDGIAIVKSLDRNIILVYDKDTEVIRCEGED